MLLILIFTNCFLVTVQLFLEYESGMRPFPCSLDPGIPEDLKCACNSECDGSDPVEKGWRIGAAIIYKEGFDPVLYHHQK